MTILRCAALVSAPPAAVLAAVTETRTPRSALGPLGFTMTTDAAQLAVGDEIDLTWPVFALARPRIRLRLVRLTDRELVAVRVGGPFPQLRFSVTAKVTGAGTLVTSAVAWTLPYGVPAALLGRRTVLRAQAALLARVHSRAIELGRAPVVVGAVVVRDGTVLAAQRDRPESTAGRWEFPGGKVEDGEGELAALARECREELGTETVVLERFGPDLPLPGGAVLRLYTAELAGRPSALEHRALRWVPAADLAGLDWLDADRVVLPQVRDLLANDSTRSAS